MKRQIVLSFEDTMYSVFVYAHDGDVPVMSPIVSEDRHSEAVCAVPQEHLVLGTMEINEVCAFIRAEYKTYARQDSKKVSA